MLNRLVNKFGIEALIAAGVVLRTDVKCSLDRCPGCDDCDEVPRILPDPTSRIGYCAYCAKTGEKMLLEVGDICVLEYSEEGLARRFAAAFGCNDRIARRGHVWHLGKSAGHYGRARRDICLVGTLRSSELLTSKDYPPGIAYLVIAGEIDGEISDPKLKRRVFTFEQLLYLNDEQKLAIDLNQIELQLLDTEGQLNDKPPKLPSKAKILADYYCTQAFELLSLPNWDNINEAMDELRSATSLASKIGVSEAQVSRLLNLEGKNNSPNEICQLWYDICTKPESFKAFEAIAQHYQYEHNRPMKDEGALRTYQRVITGVILATSRRMSFTCCAKK